MKEHQRDMSDLTKHITTKIHKQLQDGKDVAFQIVFDEETGEISWTRMVVKLKFKVTNKRFEMASDIANDEWLSELESKQMHLWWSVSHQDETRWDNIPKNWNKWHISFVCFALALALAWVAELLHKQRTTVTDK